MNYPIEFKLGNYILRMYKDLSVTKYKKKSTRLPEMWVPIKFYKETKKRKNDVKAIYYRFELQIDGKRKTIRRHRLNYYAHHQDWDIFDSSLDNQIDHIHGTDAGDYIHNLRIVTHHQNQLNQQNAKGYRWREDRKKWIAYICLDKKNFQITCDTEEEAIEARKKLKLKYHSI
jgi:hypothetical protein